MLDGQKNVMVIVKFEKGVQQLRDSVSVSVKVVTSLTADQPESDTEYN